MLEINYEDGRLIWKVAPGGAKKYRFPLFKIAKYTQFFVQEQSFTEQKFVPKAVFEIKNISN